MATTLVRQIEGPGSVRLLASSTLAEPVYRWWVNGRAWAMDDTTGVLTLVGSLDAAVEVRDQEEEDPAAIGSLEGSGGAALEAAWEGRGIPGATAFVVSWEAAEGSGNYVDIGIAGPGAGIRRLAVREAEDDRVHRLRVRAVMGGGLEVPVAELAGLVAGVPAAPAFGAAVNNGEIVATEVGS